MPRRVNIATLLGCLCLAYFSPMTHAAANPSENTAMTAPAADIYQVIEFRRYTIKPGKREAFGTYFETYFPEAFQQLGAMALGQGVERDHTNGFTWLRGFHSMEARAITNSAFYYGPVWKEHRNTLNGLIDDSDNVYLMRPLDTAHAVTALPAVDPIAESHGAGGIWVAQLFTVKSGAVDSFAKQADESFARYRAAGVQQSGVLVTLDANNNFPQLPIRTDGPYLLWLGVAKDKAAVDSWQAMAREEEKRLQGGAYLARDTEEIVITPTHRSRLRWRDG
jgi:hypothetical protein